MIEFDRVKITVSYNRKLHSFCLLCNAESEFIAQAEAAGILKILQQQGLCVQIEKLHFYEPNAEQTFVCLNSIVEHGNQFNIFLTNGDT